jgi:2-C-methyl-D-erythritol 4-phosphate cytidylyltransferase
MRTGVVIPAAGRGTRLGGRRKPFLELAGEPVLVHALRPFLQHPSVEAIAVALPPSDVAAPPAWLAALDPRIRLVPGGEERGDSVRAALAALPAELDVIVVHDAARPLVSAAIVERAIAAAGRGLGVVVAVPVTDSIKEVAADGRIVGSPDRRRLWAAQTPQAFPAALLRAAYQRAEQEGITATDDAALVAHCGGTVVVLEGDPANLKITTLTDLVIAAALLRP